MPGLGLAELREALVSSDPAHRAAALLRARSEPGVEDVLIEGLADPVLDVRRSAARSLGRMAGPRGIHALARASAGDISPAVRIEAIGAVGRVLAVRMTTEGSP